MGKLSEEAPVDVAAAPVADGRWQVTVVGFNHPGELAIICGLLFAYGCNIVDGNAFSEENVAGSASRRPRGVTAIAHASSTKFIDVFTVEPPTVFPEGGLTALWKNYAAELADLIREVRSGRVGEVQGRLAKRVASAVPATSETATTLYPVEIEIDNEISPRSTVLRIRSEDTMGFLYELANALALAGIDILRMTVDSRGNRAFDTLYATDITGEKITDPVRQSELRAAIVLIKHFTHLLPRSPNPEAALLHFRDFLAQLFQQSDWLHELASLERSDVLAALARLLGVSDFLWEDFLRLQHMNLFPVVRDISGLEQRKSREALTAELSAELADARDHRRAARATQRVQRPRDVSGRHAAHSGPGRRVRPILCRAGGRGRGGRGGRTRYLSVRARKAFRPAARLRGSSRPCLRVRPGQVRRTRVGLRVGHRADVRLRRQRLDDRPRSHRHGRVLHATGRDLHAHDPIAAKRGFFKSICDCVPTVGRGAWPFRSTRSPDISARKGRPGPTNGRRSVKLRPIAGDLQFGSEIVALRDRLIYSGEPFDVAAMRAMREKQLRQLVRAGTTNAKLSPGQLVDTEYLVQGLQITNGHLDPSLRAVNTLDALTALKDRDLISAEDAARLREAYVFQRGLIDALRIVRGHARDLTVPATDSEEFVFLARRLGYGGDGAGLRDDIERYAETVRQMGRLLDR